MKTLPTLLAFALLALAPLPAPAAAPPPAVITVTGQGKATATPDMATETFTIATNASAAAAATTDNNARYNRFLKAVRALGVAESDMRTTGFNVNYNPPPQPQPGEQPPSPPQRYGYFVNRSVQVTLHDLSRVGKVIDAAVGAGVTDIGDVSFDVSNRKAQYAIALRDAVNDAHAQAQAMAAAAGLHLLRVKSMDQGQGVTFVRPGIQSAMYKAAPPVPTQIQPSNVEVNASVTVTYEALR